MVPMTILAVSVAIVFPAFTTTATLLVLRLLLYVVLFRFDAELFSILVDVLDDVMGFLLQILSMKTIPQLAHTVAEVDLNAALIDQDIVHS